MIRFSFEETKLCQNCVLDQICKPRVLNGKNKQHFGITTWPEMKNKLFKNTKKPLQNPNQTQQKKNPNLEIRMAEHFQHFC